MKQAARGRIAKPFVSTFRNDDPPTPLGYLGTAAPDKVRRAKQPSAPQGRVWKPSHPPRKVSRLLGIRLPDTYLLAAVWLQYQ